VVAYDPEAETYRAYFDPSDPGAVAVAVSRAVATVLGVPVDELGPLEGCVDAEALGDLLQSRPTAGETPGSGLAASFTFEGVEVTVRDDGLVTLRDRTARTRSSG